MKTIAVWLALLLVFGAVACGGDEEQTTDPGDPGLPLIDDDTSVDDDTVDDDTSDDDTSDDDTADDDIVDDDTSDDDTSDDDTADDDTADDDTVSAECADAMATVYGCLWFVPTADVPLTQDEAEADCDAHAILDEDTWGCIMECANALEADCSNFMDELPCIPLCVYHAGHVPDPGTCTPQFPAAGVCAHRGAIKYAPENTVPAYEFAIEQGADVVEVDVQSTFDEQLICMHDSDVSTTTNGEGQVGELTLAEILAFDVDDAAYGDAFPGLKVPTFAEALATMKDQAMVDIDVKTDRIDLIVQAVSDAGMHDQVMAFCSSYDEVDAFLAIDPTFPVMPRASTPEEVAYILATYDPLYVEVDEGCDDADTLAAIHAAGATTFMDALGLSDLLMALAGRLDGWYNMYDVGIDIIQTDFAHVLVAFEETLCE